MVETQLGRYQIVEEIGSGAMGVVYRARDPNLDRDVALKVLAPTLTSDKSARARLRREAKILSRLNHPNIAVIHDFSTSQDADFLVMELIDGQTLSRILAKRRLATDEAVRIGLEIADALAEAHEHGLVHRDLKPGNIMLTPKGRVKVLDFGLAKPSPSVSGTEVTVLTEGPIFAGTIPYMSPEQLRCENLSPRSDIHALGTVLYEVVTGRRAFPEDEPLPLMDAILYQPPDSPHHLEPEISPDLERIILKCLEKDPEHRYQSMKEVIAELTAVVRRESLPVESPVVPESSRAMIVVLPFRNLGDPKDQYLADGLSEEITSRIAQIGGLGVIASTSALRYTDTQKSIREIGREMGVDHVLEGTVRTEHVPGGPDRIRVIPKLVRVDGEDHLWTNRFTVGLDPGEIFRIQADIAEQVAAALDIALSDQELKSVRKSPTADLDAYQAYLLGRFEWSRRNAISLERAAEHFRDSIRRDPGFALAHAGLADTYVLFPFYGIAVVAANEAFELAIGEAQRAIDLDGTLAEAHTALAKGLMSARWKWKDAEREFRHALSLNPDYANAHHCFAELLAGMGRMEEALAHSEQAVQLSPSFAAARDTLALLLLNAGRGEEAEAELRHVIEQEPGFLIAHFDLGNVFLKRGDLRQTEAEWVRSGMAPDVARLLARAQADPAIESGFGHELAELEKLYPFPDPILAAHACALAGDAESAFERLEEGARTKSEGVLYLRLLPGFSRYQSDPRFQKFLRRTGLTGHRQDP
jgi:serine/threonine protein kinase/tetratricopeptide (TPR) repeat protein